jgi:hypothetical protein
MSGESYERVRRPLGYAVHPDAINRLLELWPDARVLVSHGYERQILPGPTLPGFRGQRATRVVIRESDDENSRWIGGEALCSPEDQFSRRRGIEIAFRRALRGLSSGHVYPPPKPRERF